MAESPGPMEETEFHEPAEWTDAIRENPLLFAALLVVFCIVVFLAGLAIYLLGVRTGVGPGLPPLPTTNIQFATPTPPTDISSTVTPSPVGPSIDMLSVQGESGTLITVTGQNWTPGDTLVITVEDPAGTGGVQPLYTNVQADSDGTFIASFILPANTGWANLSSLRITVESSTTGERVTTEFAIVASTPTATVPPVDTPTPPPGSTPTPTTVYLPTQGDWLGEYFANPSLVGSPRLVRNETAIDFDWGLNAPAPSLPADGFSARWTRTTVFDPSVYRFHLLATDGIRLWVNEELIIDEWFASPQREIAIDYPVFNTGNFNIRVEYVNFSGPATIRFRWEKFPLPPPPDHFPPYAYWHGEYWPNRDLFGSPSLVRQDPDINFNWGTGSPAPGFPSDNYSIRWQRTVDFESTNYRFYLTVNDGARLWVGNQLLIDEWRDGETREITADLTMTGGPHELRVEYYKNTGEGVVRLRWEKATAATVTPTSTATPIGYYPDWRGEYWPNAGLNGNPLLVRNDPQINFNWGLGSPDPNIPADNFSVRWSRSYPFENGVYRFTAQVKDGIRFYVDGNLVLDKWLDVPNVTTYVIDLNLNGRHWLDVEYFNGTGEAVAAFGWQQVVVTPTPVPSATPTLTPIPTNTLTPVATATLTPLPTATLVPPSTFTPTPNPTSTATLIPLPTNTPVLTPTLTVTGTITPEATGGAIIQPLPTTDG